MSCVAELDTILQSMLALKPPGVTGGKIQSITTLCNANIQVRFLMFEPILVHTTVTNNFGPVVRNRLNPTRLHTFQKGPCVT